MIKVVITKEKEISNIEIKGHAEYEEKGKDIVCASVSSILTTTVNAILRIDSESITYEQNNGICLSILKHSEVIDILLENMIHLLEELERQYPDNIKIIKK